MTNNEGYNQLGKFCLEKKADCNSDLFHCDLMRNYVLEHTIPKEESKRIELGADQFHWRDKK